MPTTRSSLDHYQRFIIRDEAADVSFMVMCVRLFVFVFVFLLSLWDHFYFQFDTQFL